MRHGDIRRDENGRTFLIISDNVAGVATHYICLVNTPGRASKGHPIHKLQDTFVGPADRGYPIVCNLADIFAKIDK